jgi:ABC-type polysaccharide/polyol phosphate export permease
MVIATSNSMALQIYATQLMIRHTTITTSLKEVYEYRSLLINLVVTELRLRYRRSVLGFVWTMLNPLLTMSVITVVFSTVFRFGVEDFAILLLAGLLPWNFFEQSISSSLMSIVGKGGLIRKVYFPKAILPLATVLANLINFLFALVPLLFLVHIIGPGLNASILFLPMACLIFFVFVTGFSFFFACINVFFRDFSHMTDVLMRALFYASPILYTIDFMPDGMRKFLLLNPLSYYIACFRDPIYYRHLPSLETVLIAVSLSVTSLITGFLVFSRYEKHFVIRV